MNIVHAVDISNWQGDLSPERARCLAENNAFVIVRLSLENPSLVARAKLQLTALRDAGCPLHGYIWGYESWNPEKTIDDAIREYDQFPLAWWWLDAEEVDDRVGQVRNGEWFWRALERLHHHQKLTGIYTGAWWWNDPAYMNGSTRFSDAGVPLWVAYYDSRPELDRWERFGGWEQAHVKQYWTSGNEQCGISPIDMNVADLDLLHPPEPPEPKPEPDPRDARIRELEDALTVYAQAFDQESAEAAVRAADIRRLLGV